MRPRARHAERSTRRLRSDLGSGFAHVVCAVDRAAPGIAVRRQAEALGAAGAVVDCVPAQPLTADRCGPLLERCDGADLLAVGAANDAQPLLERATMPILLARPGQVATEITERILVAVDDAVDPAEAAQIAGSLAARDSGQVAVVAAPPENAALARAVAATRRLVLDSAGAVPSLLRPRPSPEKAIVSAADEFQATLVVLAVGRTNEHRARVARIARRVSCSVLVLPPRRPAHAAEAHESRGPVRAMARAGL